MERGDHASPTKAEMRAAVAAGRENLQDPVMGKRNLRGEAQSDRKKPTHKEMAGNMAALKGR